MVLEGIVSKRSDLPYRLSCCLPCVGQSQEPGGAAHSRRDVVSMFTALTIERGYATVDQGKPGFRIV
jgi:hypothetical protein